jgi:hypothetical protein
MKMNLQIRVIAFVAGALLIPHPAPTAAQSTGRIDFIAHVTPTGGRPEPVRQLTFYLLRKSVEEIRKEAAETAPDPGLAKFIDALSVSPELKAWMNQHHSVRLSGEEFTKSLTPEDVVGIPEFFKAYMTHNAAFRGVGFPEPKMKEKERESNPEKYKAQKEQYQAAVRKFIAGAPETVQGIDLELVDLNPYAKWQALERKRGQMVESRAFRLAQERYVVSRADTDLEGHGIFTGVLPGAYWIGMFGAEAISGDVRLRWDFPVTVRSGENANVELSNLNAAKFGASAEDSDY